MNLPQFLEHWRIVENPFRGEEARQDPVFLRLEAVSQGGVSGNAKAATISGVIKPGATTHSDFEKIAGDFAQPSTAIVFGEKGSGKTAIRLQLADRLSAFNAAHPDARCLWIGLDDLNPVLGRFVERTKVERKATVADTLAKFRLVDHIDAILTSGTTAVVDAVLKERSPTQGSGPPAVVEPREDVRKIIKKMDSTTRRDLLAMQVAYDGAWAASGGENRTRKLRRALRIAPPIGGLIWSILAYLGWAPAVAVAVLQWRAGQITADPMQFTRADSQVWVVAGMLAAYLIILVKRSVYDRVKYLTLGHRLRKQVRVSSRSDSSFGRSLRAIPQVLVDPAVLPLTGVDETRYAMLDRLKRVLKHFGYASVLVVVDRVDEPTLISGDPERMKSVVWPMLNNKFLQQPGLGVKMLLPMELRHALFRESASFFQEARLDKQNLIERLNWTGAMLYDLCDARLRACLDAAAEPITLLDLFAEDVTKQDLIDTLDQMHQPRDAFKLLYQCFTEHCASVTSDQSQWRIPRLTLESVKKAQVERVKQLYRGIRPA